MSSKSNIGIASRSTAHQVGFSRSGRDEDIRISIFVDLGYMPGKQG